MPLPPPPPPKGPPHPHIAGSEAVIHFILLPRPTPVQPHPHPHWALITLLIQEACPRSPLPPHSCPAGGARPRDTAAHPGLLSLTARVLAEPRDLWTLIFLEPPPRPFLPSGLSGCLSPTPPPAPPLVFNLKHPSGASRAGRLQRECIKPLTALLISSPPPPMQDLYKLIGWPVPCSEEPCPFPLSRECPLTLARAEAGGGGACFLQRMASPLPAPCACPVGTVSSAAARALSSR